MIREAHHQAMLTYRWLRNCWKLRSSPLSTPRSVGYLNLRQATADDEAWAHRVVQEMGE